jgi:hypothetical protein
LTTPRRSRQNPAIREYILANVDEHPSNVGALAAKEFGISRTAVSRYMKRLVDENLLEATGKTNAKTYKPKVISSFATRLIPIPPSENEVWREEILPNVKNVSPNVVDICQYGFTEMFNNVIDHSGSRDVIISYEQTYTTITMRIIDNGVGIFEKIQKDFNLEDPRTALLELSKGKLTSDQRRHSGEGIFFTSRMFDRFQIMSGHLYYGKKRQDDWGWLIETEDLTDYVIGTTVAMIVSPGANWTVKEIFEKSQDDDYRFSKTHVPITLGKYPGEQLVSRSQAKRLLARFERFSEVFLDFRGVNEIGQAFADEIFRVFPSDHPTVQIFAMNASDEIQKMIQHVKSGGTQLPLL